MSFEYIFLYIFCTHFLALTKKVFLSLGFGKNEDVIINQLQIFSFYSFIFKQFCALFDTFEDFFKQLFVICKSWNVFIEWKLQFVFQRIYYQFIFF